MYAVSLALSITSCATRCSYHSWNPFRLIYMSCRLLLKENYSVSYFFNFYRILHSVNSSLWSLTRWILGSGQREVKFLILLWSNFLLHKTYTIVHDLQDNIHSIARHCLIQPHGSFHAVCHYHPAPQEISLTHLGVQKIWIYSLTTCVNLNKFFYSLIFLVYITGTWYKIQKVPKVQKQVSPNIPLPTCRSNHC